MSSFIAEVKNPDLMGEQNYPLWYVAKLVLFLCFAKLLKKASTQVTLSSNPFGWETDRSIENTRALPTLLDRLLTPA